MNFGSALEQVHRRAPLVDCITNFVTVNDCANILLAVGGSPTMASDIREVQETAAAASALLCNLGAIDKVESMILGGQAANRAANPWSLTLWAPATPASAGRNRPGCWTPCSLRSSGATRRRFALWPSAGRRAAAWT